MVDGCRQGIIGGGFAMSGVKLFRKADRDLTPNERSGAVRGLINPLHSDTMGGGIGSFENCANAARAAATAAWPATDTDMKPFTDGLLKAGVEE